MRKEYANGILAMSQAGYETIASDFSRTRGTFWKELLFVRDLIPENTSLLDIGCGNGRFLAGLDESNITAPTPLSQNSHPQPALSRTAQGRVAGEAWSNITYTGIDFSEGLINVARERYRARANTTFTVGDALALPFHDHTFDSAVSFAVLHHIPSRAYRIQFLREASRVVKPGGQIILTAWNVWHSKPTMVLKFALLKLFGKTHLDFGDAILHFGAEKNSRYVHSLTMREIRSLAREANLTIERLEKIRRPSGEENFFVILNTQRANLIQQSL